MNELSMPRSNELIYFSETQNDQIMKPLIDAQRIKTLKYSDYKKALKRDRKWLSKGQALIFLGQYRFADNKKGLGILLFKKLAAAKQVFKELKKSGIPNPKIAIGTYQVAKENGKAALQVQLLRGGLTVEKIQTGGKQLFGPLWQVDLSVQQGVLEENKATKRASMSANTDTNKMGSMGEVSSKTTMSGTNFGMGGEETEAPQSPDYEAFQAFRQTEYTKVMTSKDPAVFKAALAQLKTWIMGIQATLKTADPSQKESYQIWAMTIHKVGLRIKAAAQKLGSTTSSQKIQLQDLAKRFLVQGKRYQKSMNPSIKHEAWKQLQLMEQELKSIEPTPPTQKAHQQLSTKLAALLKEPKVMETNTKTVDPKAIEALKGEIIELLNVHTNDKYQLQKAS